MTRWWLIPMVFMFSCSPDPSKPAKGFLEVDLTLQEVAEIQPSFQTVIWLEDDKGDYVRSLYVSEYLSYGGYHDSTICTAWIKKANWANMPASMYDLVTQATPPMGSRTFRFSCLDHQIRPGRYHVKVQTHLVEKYNIQYDGMIRIGGKEEAVVGHVSYFPKKHPDAKRDALADVKARYTTK